MKRFITLGPGGDRISRMDPAVGVHDTPGYPVDDAVDRVADVLTRRHEKWRDDENDERRFVVKAESIAKIFLKRAFKIAYNKMMFPALNQIYYWIYKSNIYKHYN